MTLFLQGKIDSANAQEAEKAIRQCLAKKTFDRLVLDCSELSYITSAGLRLVLALWKENPTLSAQNVIPDVYEIFDMTGFTKMMDVQRSLRTLSVDGLPLVGEGFTANVYRLDAETIVKVFKKHRSLESVRAEIDAAKKAFIYGIPTAISFDVVKVGDHLGLVFEMLHCATLRDLILAHPERFEEYKKMYADLSYRITHTNAEGSGLQHCKGPLLEKLSVLSTVLSPEEYSKLMGMVEALPETETLTHGDFHIKNILVQNNEPILIDMDAVALGHPIFELEGIYLSFQAYNEADPTNATRFFGVPQQILDELFDALLKRYFPDKDEKGLAEVYDKIVLLGTAHLAYQTIHYQRDENGRLDKALTRLRNLLSRYDTLEL